MDDTQHFAPLGGLNYDVDPQHIADGDYTAAKNVRPITDSTESSISYVNVLGNSLAVSIANTSSQNKQFRIFLDTTNVLHREINVYRTNGTVFFTVNWIDGATYDLSNTAFQAAFTAAAAAATPSQSESYIHLAGSGYTDVSLTTVTGYEYDIRNSGAMPPGTNVVVQCIQEAWDKSLEGAVIVIGSFDLLGDCFVWSTPRTVLPSSQLITGATVSSSGGLIQILFSTAHGLVSGQSIAIQSENGTSKINGTWIAHVVDPTTITLGNSVFVDNTSTAFTMLINVNGIGEIGVCTYSADTGVYTYIRLIKSKEFNFTTKKQIDSKAEENAVRKSLYWTDNYNVPRVLYYEGVYVTDGAIKALNPQGLYAYGTIGVETKLIVSASFDTFTFTDQVQSGGSVKSGNWRYAIRFLTDGLNGTEWSDLSNPINVFKASTAGDPKELCGDDSGVTTSKINEFLVSGIIPGIFKYIELAGVNYIDSAVVGYNLRREVLSDLQTSIVLRHTGSESNVTDLDIGTLGQLNFNYLTAKSIAIIDNRLVLTNLTTNQVKDFSIWTQTWKHSVKRKAINGTKQSTSPSYRVGEYYEPLNVYSNLGYMHNEVYRFVAKLKLKDGSVTPVFWVDDIRIDTSGTNITNPFTPGRRVAGLASFDLTTTGANPDVYSAYVEFSNITLDSLIDGVSVRDLVEEIIIMRAECVKEVLCTGLAVVSIYNAAIDVPLFLSDGSTLTYETGALSPRYGEYAYFTGRDDGAFFAYPNGCTPNRKLFSLYSPDVMFNNSSLSYESGDQIYNMGAQYKDTSTTANKGGTHLYGAAYAEYTGDTTAGAGSATLIPITANAVSFSETGAGSTSIAGVSYSKRLGHFTGGPTPDFSWFNYRSYVINVNTTDLLPIGVNADYGQRYVQYYRALAYNSLDDNKYGRRELSSCIPTGSSVFIETTTSSPVTITEVFGGDSFTQKSFIRCRFAANYTAGGVSTLGYEGGVGFYSQNRVNSQMNRRYGNGIGTFDYPNIGLPEWLNDDSSALVSYNSGYTPREQEQLFASYDSNAANINVFPTRIAYSEVKLNGSLNDNYRKFLPLNFKDIDQVFGPIVHHDNANGELVTWQPRKIQRQYFNTRGVLETAANLGVLIGDGSVLSRDGNTLSVIGTKHKWSVIKGKSAQGNDVFYWINTELKKVMRLGYDGTISLADIRGMQSFFANNLAFVDDNDTPADGEGIHGVWDDRFLEAIFTIRAKRIFSQWNDATSYVVGNTVSYQPSSFSTFERTGEIYVCTMNNIGHAPDNYELVTNGNFDGSAAGWTLGSGWSYAFDHLVCSHGSEDVSQPIPGIVAGKTYKITFEIDPVDGGVIPSIGGVDGGLYTAGGGFIVTLTAINADDLKIKAVSYTGALYSVSVVEVPTNNPFWRIISHSDSNYYNEYTIAFNELKNKFTTFYTFLPKIYLKWKDTFLSQRPIPDIGTGPEMPIYIHNKGEYCKWYFYGSTDQEEDGYLEGVINKYPDETKWYDAIRVSSEITPERFDFKTKKHISFLTNGEIEALEDHYDSPIKEDSTNTGVNDGDTTLLFGTWLKVKMTFKKLVYQRLFNFIVKIDPSSPTTNK